MKHANKWYISFDCTLWDKRVVALLEVLKGKAKYILCGIESNNKENLTQHFPDAEAVFWGDNSVAFISELYRYWNQPTDSLCFDWYLTDKSPKELIYYSDNYLLTDDLTDIQNAVMSISIVEYRSFAVCIKDYQGVFSSMLNELSDLFEGENQFTEFKNEYIRFI